MIRSEKNKINHLSIVFSGMSSVSLGWGVRGTGRGEWERPNLPHTFRSFGFLLPEDGGRARGSRENVVMASPMITGRCSWGPGALQSLQRDSAGQWGPQGLLVGCIVGLRGSRRLWDGDQGCGLSAVGRATE